MQIKLFIFGVLGTISFGIFGVLIEQEIIPGYKDTDVEVFYANTLVLLTPTTALLGLHLFAQSKGLYSLVRNLIGNQVGTLNQGRKEASLSKHQDQLLKNKELLDKGILTEKEYNSLQAKIKSRIL